MPDLATIQKSMIDAIVSKNPDLNYIKNNGNISNYERFAIHKQTVIENLVKSLQITFPGIWQLIGDDCTRGVALAYSHNLSHLKSRHNLNDFGDKFPDYLANFTSTKHIKYLKDFAQMELLRSLSYSAPKEIAIEPMELQTIEADKLADCVVTLNKSVQLMQSDFPLNEIESVINNPDTESINLSDKSVYILIYRFEYKVITSYINQELYIFINDLANKVSLETAIEKLYQQNPNINIGKILEFILEKKLISKID